MTDWTWDAAAARLHGLLTGRSERHSRCARRSESAVRSEWEDPGHAVR